MFHAVENVQPGVLVVEIVIVNLTNVSSPKYN